MIIELTNFEMKLLGHIEEKKLSASGLAKKLRVSRVTVARAIASLRKKGFVIKCKRDSAGWYYFLGAAKRRKPDPLDNIIGVFSSDVGDLAQKHDKYLYESQE